MIISHYVLNYSKVCGTLRCGALRSGFIARPSFLQVARNKSGENSDDEEYLKAKKVLDQCFEPQKPTQLDIGTINPYFLKYFSSKKPVGRSPEECKAIIDSIFGKNNVGHATTGTRKFAIFDEVERLESLTKSDKGYTISVAENNNVTTTEVVLNAANEKNIKHENKRDVTKYNPDLKIIKEEYAHNTTDTPREDYVILAKDTKETRPILTGENIPVFGNEDPLTAGEYARLPRKNRKWSKEKKTLHNKPTTKITKVDDVVLVDEPDRTTMADEGNYALDPLIISGYKRDNKEAQNVEMNKDKKIFQAELASIGLNTEKVKEDVDPNKLTTDDMTMYEEVTETKTERQISSAAQHLLNKSVPVGADDGPIMKMLQRIREISKTVEKRQSFFTCPKPEPKPEPPKNICPPPKPKPCPPNLCVKSIPKCPEPKLKPEPPKSICPPPKPKPCPPNPCVKPIPKCPEPKPKPEPPKSICPPPKPKPCPPNPCVKPIPKCPELKPKPEPPNSICPPPKPKPCPPNPCVKPIPKCPEPKPKPEPPKSICPPPKPKPCPPNPCVKPTLKCPEPEPKPEPPKSICPPPKPNPCAKPAEPKPCPPPKPASAKLCCSQILMSVEPRLPQFQTDSDITKLNSPYTSASHMTPLNDYQEIRRSSLLGETPTRYLIPPLSDITNEVDSVSDIFSYPCEPFREPFAGLRRNTRSSLDHSPKTPPKLRLKKKPRTRITTKDAIVLTLITTDPKSLLACLWTVKGFNQEEKPTDAYLMRIRSKSYDPWVPIPSFPPVKRAPACKTRKNDCDTPPFNLPRLTSDCKENPCKMLPRWTNIRYKLSQWLFELFPSLKGLKISLF